MIAVHLPGRVAKNDPYLTRSTSADLDFPSWARYHRTVLLGIGDGECSSYILDVRADLYSSVEVNLPCLAPTLRFSSVYTSAFTSCATFEFHVQMLEILAEHTSNQPKIKRKLAKETFVLLCKIFQSRLGYQDEPETTGHRSRLSHGRPEFKKARWNIYTKKLRTPFDPHFISRQVTIIYRLLMLNRGLRGARNDGYCPSAPPVEATTPLVLHCSSVSEILSLSIEKSVLSHLS